MKYKAKPIEVEAHTVKSVEAKDMNGDMTAVLEDDSRVTLTPAMTARYSPVVGDYVVTQEDGYVYVNPKAVFERKYEQVGSPNTVQSITGSVKSTGAASTSPAKDPEVAFKPSEDPLPPKAA